MDYNTIAILMFSTMLLMMITGQRVFGAIGVVAVVAALTLWGPGGTDMGFSAVMKLMKWTPLLTLPMFVFMGYVMSESRLAEDLYRMFHVWFGALPGGLAIGTILLMVMISAMNGLSVAGMAIGTTIALPELVRRGYDRLMISGVIQAGSSLGILIPPSVVLVLFALIARTFAEYPYPPRRIFAWLVHFKGYWSLAASGLLGFLAAGGLALGLAYWLVTVVRAERRKGLIPTDSNPEE